MRIPSATLVTGAIALTMVLFASSAPLAATLASGEVFSSILVQPVATPSPVLGADDRVHLAYELLVVNPSSFLVTLDEIEALAPGGAVLAELKGERLEKLLRVNGGGKDRTLPAGGSAYVLMDVALAKDAPLPDLLRHRISISRMNAGANGAAPAPPAPGSAIPATDSFIGAATTVDQTPAVVVAPPLRGGGWLVFNGCCDALTSHRGAILAVNGAPHVAERFAIDFVQLDQSDRLFTGPVDQLASYRYFGVPVYAVADGTVVNLEDGLPEEVPGKVPASSSPKTAGGNFAVVDIGGGRFAFYAHLQPGSLRVKLGDRVASGDVLGLLGNSGNTTAPHLHFHVMDRPSPLAANGLPYVFTAFVGEGLLDESRSGDFFSQSVPATIDRSVLAGPHAAQLPLNDEIVRFAE